MFSTYIGIGGVIVTLILLLLTIRLFTINLPFFVRGRDAHGRGARERGWESIIWWRLHFVAALVTMVAFFALMVTSAIALGALPSPFTLPPSTRIDVSAVALIGAAAQMIILAHGQRKRGPIDITGNREQGWRDAQ